MIRNKRIPSGEFSISRVRITEEHEREFALRITQIRNSAAPTVATPIFLKQQKDSRKIHGKTKLTNARSSKNWVNSNKKEVEANRMRKTIFSLSLLHLLGEFLSLSADPLVPGKSSLHFAETDLGFVCLRRHSGDRLLLWDIYLHSRGVLKTSELREGRCTVERARGVSVHCLRLQGGRGGGGRRMLSLVCRVDVHPVFVVLLVVVAIERLHRNVVRASTGSSGLSQVWALIPLACSIANGEHSLARCVSSSARVDQRTNRLEVAALQTRVKCRRGILRIQV